MAVTHSLYDVRQVAGKQTIKVMCGKCGHRRLDEFSIDDSWTAQSMQTPSHLFKQPSGNVSSRVGDIGPVAMGPALDLGKPPWAPGRSITAQLMSRWTYKCHRRCGNVVPVRQENLQTALQRALDKGRRVIWLPNDL
jgi:hypothetical protein